MELFCDGGRRREMQSDVVFQRRPIRIVFPIESWDSR